MPNSNQPACEKIFRDLQQACGTVLDETFKADNEALQSASFNFVSEAEHWLRILDSRAEAQLYRTALREYQFALLALAQGQYRQAFMALRLFFELFLGGVFYSANELHLRYWMRGIRDTSWQSISESDNGVFSKVFINAFFSELAEFGQQHRAIATAVYRECSEFVHGNMTTLQFLPGALNYQESTFKDWHEKAKAMRLVTSFVLAARYLKDLDSSQKLLLEAFVLDSLGHLPPIRDVFDKK